MKIFDDDELALIDPLSIWDAEVLSEYGKSIICGVDEVGRGALAGPICATAVIISPQCHSLGIKDSKRFSSREKREQVCDKIINACVSYHTAFVDANLIDDMGIQEANRKVMIDATKNINVDRSELLIVLDGRSLWTGDLDGTPCSWVEKGDAKSLAIAAASVVAKVMRDRLMTDLASEYPEYGFENHVGYGSKEHIKAIRKYGSIPLIHRETFIHLGEEER